MGLSHSKEDDLDQDLPLDSQHLQREEQSGLELLRGTIGAALGAQEPPDPRDGPTLLCIQSRLPNSPVPGPTSQTTPARARPVSNVHHLHFGASPASLKHAPSAFRCKVLCFSPFPFPRQQLRYGKNWQVSPKLSIRPHYR